jgi:hypothetical protein
MERKFTANGQRQKRFDDLKTILVEICHTDSIERGFLRFYNGKSNDNPKGAFPCKKKDGGIVWIQSK